MEPVNHSQLTIIEHILGVLLHQHTDYNKKSYHFFFSSWFSCVEDLVVSDIAYRRIPAHGQSAEGRVNDF